MATSPLPLLLLLAMMVTGLVDARLIAARHSGLSNLLSKSDCRAG